MLTDIDLPSIEYVCLHLRAADAEEIFAIRPHNSPILLAWEAHYLIRNSGRGRVAWWNGRPSAVIALVEERKGVWSVSMFGTDEFKNVAFTCMRWARATLRELVLEHGAQRLHCDSHVNHHEAHRFLRAMGAVEEGPPMQRFGKDGASYQKFVWLAGVNDQVLAGPGIRSAGFTRTSA